MIKIDRDFLILFVLILIIFVATAVYYYHKTVQDGTSMNYVDFRVYYYAGNGLETARDIYDTSDGYYVYKYSPIFALIMSVIRFSNRTPAQALCVWYAILFISFVLSLNLTREILFYSRGSQKVYFFDIVPLLFIFRYLVLINFTSSFLPMHWPVAVKIFDWILLSLAPFYILSLLFKRDNSYYTKSLLTMVLATLFILRFLVLNIDRAQANIVILALLLFFAYYLVNNKHLLAGLYLGIAIAFKLSPVIFLLYLAAKKRFKALISSVITFAALLVMPSFRWGIDQNIGLLKGWANALKMTLPAEYLQYKNQSLLAAISRFFSENSDIALIRLNEAGLMGLIVVAYALVIGILLHTILKKSPFSENESLLRDLSLFFIAMVLLSPVGTKTTFIHLLLPLAMLVNNALKKRLKDKSINVGLLAFTSMVYLNSSDIIGELSLLLHKYSLMTLSLLLLFLMTIINKKEGDTLTIR